MFMKKKYAVAELYQAVGTLVVSTTKNANTAEKFAAFNLRLNENTNS